MAFYRIVFERILELQATIAQLEKNITHCRNKEETEFVYYQIKCSKEWLALNKEIENEIKKVGKL